MFFRFHCIKRKFLFFRFHCIKHKFLFFQESRKFDQGLFQLQQLALPKLQLERLSRRLRRSKGRKNYQNDARFWGKQTICCWYIIHTKLNFEEANFSLFVYCSYKTRFWGTQTIHCFKFCITFNQNSILIENG